MTKPTNLERVPPSMKMLGTSTTYSNEKTKFGEITTWCQENYGSISILKDSLEGHINSLDLQKEKEDLSAKKKELRKEWTKELYDMCAKVGRERLLSKVDLMG